MTVKELIDILKNYDEDLCIVARIEGTNTYSQNVYVAEVPSKGITIEEGI